MSLSFVTLHKLTFYKTLLEAFGRTLFGGIENTVLPVFIYVLAVVLRMEETFVGEMSEGIFLRLICPRAM